MTPLQLQQAERIASALGSVQGLLVALFLVATMAGIGLRLTRGDVSETLRSTNQIARWLLANLLAVPLFAVLLGLVFDLSEPVLIGLLLVAVAPAAPFIPRIVRLAGEESTSALRITAALTVVAAVTVPVVTLALALLFGLEREIALLQFFVPLVAVLVAPILVGMAVRDRSPRLADRAAPTLLRIANLALLGALLVIVVLEPGAILRVLVSLLGTGTLLVLVVFILGSIGIGWLVGGPTDEDRRILALATAARNVGISLFLATAAFPGSDAESSIVAFTVLMFAVSGGVAYLLGHRRRALQPSSG